MHPSTQFGDGQYPKKRDTEFQAGNNMNNFAISRHLEFLRKQSRIRWHFTPNFPSATQSLACETAHLTLSLLISPGPDIAKQCCMLACSSFKCTFQDGSGGDQLYTSNWPDQYIEDHRCHPSPAHICDTPPFHIPSLIRRTCMQSFVLSYQQ